MILLLHTSEKKTMKIRKLSLDPLWNVQIRQVLGSYSLKTNSVTCSSQGSKTRRMDSANNNQMTMLWNNVINISHHQVY